MATVRIRNDVKKLSLLKQLEWIISHLDVPTEGLPKSLPHASLMPRLMLYREDQAARKDLFKQYHAVLARAEAAAAEAELAAGKNKDAMGVEAARRVIDDFLRKWDGADPMSGPPAASTAAAQEAKS